MIVSRPVVVVWVVAAGTWSLAAADVAGGIAGCREVEGGWCEL